MKKTCFSISIILLSLLAHSQSFVTPTVRDIYDFSVGDSLEYSSFFSSEQYYDLDIITQKTVYGSDSIVYTFKDVNKNPGGINTSSQKLRIINLDSVFYYNKRFCDTCVDYIGDSIVAADTLYNIYSHRTQLDYNDNFGTYVPEDYTTRSISQKGFGEILNSERYIGLASGYNVVELIYCHKADGRVLGSYQLISGLDENSELLTVGMFPNPANDVVNIHTNQNLTGSTLTVTDIMGRQLSSQVINEQTVRLSTSSLTAGIYFVSINSVGQTFVRRLVVER